MYLASHAGITEYKTREISSLAKWPPLDPSFSRPASRSRWLHWPFAAGNELRAGLARQDQRDRYVESEPTMQMLFPLSNILESFVWLPE